MKIIKLEKHYPGDYGKVFLTQDHYDTLIHEDCIVVGPEGQFIAALKKKAVPMETIAEAWKFLRDYQEKTDNRGTATGVKMVARRKKDGTMQKTLRAPKGDEVVSGVAGFMDRYVRLPFCRECSFNRKYPTAYATLLPLFQQVDFTHFQLDPVGWAHAKSYAAKTRPEWLIPGTNFTSVTINKNFRTAAHLDAANLKDGTCAMLLIREGRFDGGYVVFPEWRFAVAMDTSDVVVFRNMKDFHGNTPIIGKTKNYQRCTLVHYFREGMVNCGSAVEELERAKRRVAGDPIRGENINQDFEGTDE